MRARGTSTSSTACLPAFLHRTRRCMASWTPLNTGESFYDAVSQHPVTFWIIAVAKDVICGWEETISGIAQSNYTVMHVCPTPLFGSPLEEGVALSSCFLSGVDTQYVLCGISLCFLSNSFYLLMPLCCGSWMSVSLVTWTGNLAKAIWCSTGVTSTMKWAMPWTWWASRSRWNAHKPSVFYQTDHTPPHAYNALAWHFQEKVDMMTILAGILSLGNIMFEPTENDALKVSKTSQGWLKATAVSWHRCVTKERMS